VEERIYEVQTATPDRDELSVSLLSPLFPEGNTAECVEEKRVNTSYWNTDPGKGCCG
jgi:hypothetical protein